MAAAAEETLLLDKIAKLSTKLSKYVARLKELRSPEAEASESEDELVAAIGAISITGAPVGSQIALGEAAAEPAATPAAATPTRAAGGPKISAATPDTPSIEAEAEAVLLAGGDRPSTVLSHLDAEHSSGGGIFGFLKPEDAFTLKTVCKEMNAAVAQFKWKCEFCEKPLFKVCEDSYCRKGFCGDCGSRASHGWFCGHPGTWGCLENCILCGKCGLCKKDNADYFQECVKCQKRECKECMNENTYDEDMGNDRKSTTTYYCDTCWERASKKPEPSSSSWGKEDPERDGHIFRRLSFFSDYFHGVFTEDDYPKSLLWDIEDPEEVLAYNVKGRPEGTMRWFCQAFDDSLWFESRIGGYYIIHEAADHEEERRIDGDLSECSCCSHDEEEVAKE
jgi:hypothetical protein